MVVSMIVATGGLVAYDYVAERLQPMIYIAAAQELDVAMEEDVEEQIVLIEVERDWDKSKIEEEIRSVFFETPNTMIAVAKCESGLDPNAVGPTSDHGVLQIHAPTWHEKAIELGYTNYQTDPYENIQMARYIYDVQGIEAWVCYTRDMWQRHL